MRSKNQLSIHTKENMLVKKIEMKATISTGNYSNIQPCIELQDVDHAEGTAFAMEYVKELFAKYGERGGIKENAIESEVGIEMPSFNEAGVTIEKCGHSYYYKGEKLLSATSWLKQYYKEFDAPKIAEACSKSWGVPVEDILAMWDSKKTVAADLGTLVEAAIQHYDRFYAMGEKISAKNGKENPAVALHPIVRKVVEEFAEMDWCPEGVENVTILPQVLVTDVKNMRVGLVDRLLVTGEKRGRVQDYKVNIDADKADKNNKLLGLYSELEPTKLSKYRLQMSYYADMLKNSGWTIDGLDALVYENEWKKYTLETLDIF